jgi:alkylation response protein AidB-like acyl-CoA dehydrogenase
MDFEFSAADRALRTQAIDFTRENWKKDAFDTAILINWHHTDPAAEEATHEFAKKLVAKKWYTMHWPTEHGGDGVGITTQLAYREAMAYAGAPASLGGGLVAPVLMVSAPKWMQDEFLPRIANADLDFSQGFSEPDAGSDLASLQTRAVRDGDDYILNGQKIWGTYRNDWIHILVRTDPEAPKHRGITYMLAPLKDEKGEYLPGINVRGIPDALGRHRWDELFMENVRVPARYIIGEENRGWYAAMTTLSFERSNIQGPATLLRVVEDYLDYAHRMKRRVGSSPLDSATFRAELANLRVEVEALRMLSYRVGWMQAQGQIPQKEASMTKLWGDLQNQRVYKTLSRGLEDYGNILPYGKYPMPLGGFLNNRAFSSVTLSIAGGTTEVQRGIIAQRGLGLPR